MLELHPTEDHEEKELDFSHQIAQEYSCVHEIQEEVERNGGDWELRGADDENGTHYIASLNGNVAFWVCDGEGEMSEGELYVYGVNFEIASKLGFEPDDCSEQIDGSTEESCDEIDLSDNRL